jgi:queuosine biosynthesis protein QueC
MKRESSCFCETADKQSINAVIVSILSVGNVMLLMFNDPVFVNTPKYRFSAVDGKTQNVFEIVDKNYNFPSRTNVEYACLLSHLEVIRNFYNSEEEIALVWKMIFVWILKDIGKTIPSTYVPARNTIFLSIALAYAETLDADAIFIGVNTVDYSAYPDCRPNYIQAYQQLINIATKCGVEGKRIRIKAPLLYLSKAEIIKLGMKLNVPFKCTAITASNSCSDIL